MPKFAHVLVLLSLTLLLVGASSSAHALSPHAQFESGIPLEKVQCTDEKILLESPRGTPACVKESSVERMMHRGFVLVQTIIDVETPVDSSKPEIKPGTVEPSDMDPANGPSTDKTSVLIGSDSEGTYYASKEDHPKVIISPTQEERKRLIPSDITYDYVLEMPPKDPYALAQRIAALVDDKVVDVIGGREPTSVRSGFIKYSTERGEITISIDTGDIDNRSELEYNIYAKNGELPQLEEITQKVLDELGVEPDETETEQWDISEGLTIVPSTGYAFEQKLKGPIVHSNYGHTIPSSGIWVIHIPRHTVPAEDKFPEYTYAEHIHITIINWITNIDELQFIPLGFIYTFANSYAITSEELQGPDCKIEFDHLHKKRTTINIIEGRPILNTYSGHCTVSHEPVKRFTGGEFRYEYYANIDALTGKPLYLTSKEVQIIE